LRAASGPESLPGRGKNASAAKPISESAGTASPGHRSWLINAVTGDLKRSPIKPEVIFASILTLLKEFMSPFMKILPERIKLEKTSGTFDL
jgi:hypothetical protein